jgi:hypothetical protein
VTAVSEPLTSTDGTDYCRYHYSVLTAFPPIFLFFDPIQSVFTHLASWNVKAANERNADALEAH